MIKMNTTERFSNRVENYVKYRPTYPVAVLARLREEKVLSENAVLADIGSGTGISSKLFLENGHEVFGVEPNTEMRVAAEHYLKEEKSFHSVIGTAEDTNLKNNSVDLVLAGQAFHWFDSEKAKVEFKRILKPEGNVVLMWNNRRTDSSDFLKSYEDLLNYFGTDYKKVNHRNISEQHFDSFFGKDKWKSFSIENYFDLDFEATKGRLFSSSYVPAENHPESSFMIDVLKKVFNRYQVNGLVRFEYDAVVYYGKI